MAQIWYADANGVITGNTPTADNVASAIIDGYNEHFGTDIQIWTPETITLQVGDTVPNWNAYEKIELQIVKVKFSGGIFGEKRGYKLYIATSNGSNTIIVDMEGGFVGNLQGPELTDQMKTYFTDVMNRAGYEVSETTSETLSLSVGDPIEGWEDYIQMS